MEHTLNGFLEVVCKDRNVAHEGEIRQIAWNIQERLITWESSF